MLVTMCWYFFLPPQPLWQHDVSLSPIVALGEFLEVGGPGSVGVADLRLGAVTTKGKHVPIDPCGSRPKQFQNAVF